MHPKTYKVDTINIFQVSLKISLNLLITTHYSISYHLNSLLRNKEIICDILFLDARIYISIIEMC